MDFTKEEIAAVLNNETEVEDILIEPLIVDSPGFLSEMFQMTVTLKQDDKKYFVIKKRPTIEPANKLMQESKVDLFTRKINFFNKAVPELKKNSDKLPIVKCFIAKPNAILLENLSFQGYKIIPITLPINFDYTLLAIKKLAEFNAASVGINWLDILTELKLDIANNYIRNPLNTWLVKACLGYSELLAYIYPNIDNKYSNWLANSANVKNTFCKLIQPSEKYQNVLSHSDFWLNNIMFHFDTNIADNVKLIDFQNCRFVPGSRDIHYLIYQYYDKHFRDEHEKEIIESYVNSFNKVSSSKKLTIEEFTNEYEDGKIFGILNAIIFRSMNFMADLFSNGMTNEIMDNFYLGVQFENLIYRYQTDSNFNKISHEIIDEFIQIFDSLQL